MSLDSFPTSTPFARSVSGPLFGRIDNEFEEDEDDEISEQKNDQSHEDGEDLLADLHSWPS